MSEEKAPLPSPEAQGGKKKLPIKAILVVVGVLLMEGGTIVDRGKLNELLERSVVMRELWEGEESSR